MTVQGRTRQSYAILERSHDHVRSPKTILPCPRMAPWPYKVRRDYPTCPRMAPVPVRSHQTILSYSRMAHGAAKSPLSDLMMAHGLARSPQTIPPDPRMARGPERSLQTTLLNSRVAHGLSRSPRTTLHYPCPMIVLGTNFHTNSNVFIECCREEFCDSRQI